MIKFFFRLANRCDECLFRCAVGRREPENPYKKNSRPRRGDEEERDRDLRRLAPALRAARPSRSSARVAARSAHENTRRSPGVRVVRTATARAHHSAHRLEAASIAPARGGCRCSGLEDAAARAHQECVETFLETASTDERDAALIAAARFGHRDLAQFLWDAGASLKATGYDGLTARRAAEREGHARVAALLTELGAADIEVID